MRLFGGTEPEEAVRKATMDLTAALYQKQVSDFEFFEISELERDSFGRILVFTSFKSGEHNGQLLLIFTSVESDVLSELHQNVTSKYGPRRSAQAWNITKSAIPGIAQLIRYPYFDLIKHAVLLCVFHRCRENPL